MHAIFLWLVSLGASPLLLVPGGSIDPAVAVHHNDDVAASFGNTAAAPDAKLLWSTTGTHNFQIWQTDCDGGGTDCVLVSWDTGTSTMVMGGAIDLDGNILYGDYDDPDTYLQHSAANTWAMTCGGTASLTVDDSAITAGVDIDLNGNALTDSGHFLQLCGPMTSSHGLGAGKGGCAGAWEVDGVLYADSHLIIGFGYSIYSGSATSYGSLTPYTSYQTLKGVALATGSQANAILIYEFSDASTDFGHTKPVDPTVFIQSADATDVGQFSALSWDKHYLGGGGLAHGCINETFAYSDMVDGGGASGTFDMTETIPDGAVVLACALHSLTGFTGDTSAVVTIGDGTDVDRYNTGTPSVFTTNASGVALGDPSGTKWHDDAATVTVTITSNADFTSVSAGQATVGCCYLTP